MFAAIVTVVLALGAFLPAAHAGDEAVTSPPQYRLPPGERQLFLDDHGIAKIENLERTLHQPVKKGAVIRPDRAWETSLQVRCAPAWDEKQKLFKVWMITSNEATDKRPSAGGTTYAESKDGIHWTKPSLRQYEYDGSLENNFVTPDPTLKWGANGMENVVYDPDDPNPDRRFKGFLGVDDRQIIVSPDGIHWKKLNVPPLPSQDESNMSYDRQTRTFIATLKQRGPFGRSHTLTTSKDFEHWTKPVLVFHADEKDQRRAHGNIKARLANPKLQQPLFNNPADYKADIYNFAVFRYEGLYIGLPAVFHSTGKLPEGNTDGFHLIQLTCSRDLTHWQRLADRQSFIGPSEVGKDNYDLMQILPPSSPVEHGDELWFYYTGLKYRKRPKDSEDDLGAICLAVLRRDGFMSLDAGEKSGTVETKPFVLTGKDLFVNADAMKGTLEVELLDENGKSIGKSGPIRGNDLKKKVGWTANKLESMKGKRMILRFRLTQGSLYSFWLGD